MLVLPDLNGNRNFKGEVKEGLGPEKSERYP